MTFEIPCCWSLFGCMCSPHSVNWDCSLSWSSCAAACTCLCGCMYYNCSASRWRAENTKHGCLLQCRKHKTLHYLCFLCNAVVVQWFELPQRGVQKVFFRGGLQNQGGKIRNQRVSQKNIVYAWMNGWMSESMDLWMDQWINGWTNEINGSINE